MEPLIPDGNPHRQLDVEDYGSEGEIKTLEGDLALVVGSATKAESFLTTKSWTLLWRDADLLFQAPRPLSVYENTLIKRGHI